MKRCCKRIDITDRHLIERAVRDCLHGKMDRGDVVRMFSEYSGVPFDIIKKICKDYRMMNGLINTVIDGIQQEIINKKYIVKPIRYRKQTDKCNGKIRNIGIQDIKQQIYDYIAVYAMEELFRKKLGFYQCGALKKKGNDFGAKAIKRWLGNHSIRWAWQDDVKQYYETIPKKKLKKLLSKDVDNPGILHLVFFLIDTFLGGLSIGSYLSQYLANYYMSYAYHFASEMVLKIRKCKNGTHKTINAVCHVLFQMDDILILFRSLKDLKYTVKKFKEYIEQFLGLKLKNKLNFIDLRNQYIDILGRKVSRKSLALRSSNFIRFRRTAKKAWTQLRKDKDINYQTAKSFIGRYGAIKNSNTKHFRKKYHIPYILKRCEAKISKIERRLTHANNEIQFATA